MYGHPEPCTSQYKKSLACAMINLQRARLACLQHCGDHRTRQSSLRTWLSTAILSKPGTKQGERLALVTEDRPGGAAAWELP